MSKVHLLFSLYCVPHLSFCHVRSHLIVPHTPIFNIDVEDFSTSCLWKTTLVETLSSETPILILTWKLANFFYQLALVDRSKETPLERKLNSFKYAVVVVRIECGVCRLASLWSMLYTLYT